MQPSDGLILEIGPRLEGHLARFPAIQTHPSFRFHLAVDLDTSEELFDEMFAVNVRGPYFLMQDAAKLMIREGTAGSIVNIGSMSALSG